MKVMKQFGLIALCASALLVTKAPAFADTTDVESDVTLEQFSSDDRNELDLDSLTDASELDDSEESVEASTNGPRLHPRPRAPRRVILPRPAPHRRIVRPRPIHPPVIVRRPPVFRSYPRPLPHYWECFSENAYGQIFRATGRSFRSRVIQNFAVNSCLRSGVNYGCRPTGCR